MFMSVINKFNAVSKTIVFNKKKRFLWFSYLKNFEKVIYKILTNKHSLKYFQGRKKNSRNLTNII